MKSRTFTAIAALAAILFIAAFIACGDSSTRDEAEITTSATGEAAESVRHPFDEAPVLVSIEQPDYPAEARQAMLEGTVMVKVMVGADGTVDSVSILESSDPVFESAALQAASLTRFEPARLDGKPTRSEVAIPYQFRLNG